MSKQLKLRRGTTAQHSTFTGASGEVTVDTDKKTLVVHDGTTAGGNPVLSSAAGVVGTTNLADGLLAATTAGRAKMADAFITTAKIQDANVTTAKLADVNVTTAKIADANVTAAKLAPGAARSNFGAGAVLQVVSSTITSMQDISSIGYVDVSGMAATITPSSTSSKILIEVSMYYSNAFYPAFLVDRNGSTVVRGDASGPGERVSFGGHDLANGTAAPYRPLPLTFRYLDSPASVSALTYKLRCSSGRTAANTIRINGAYTIGDANQMITTSTITVMEIAG